MRRLLPASPAHRTGFATVFFIGSSQEESQPLRGMPHAFQIAVEAAHDGLRFLAGENKTATAGPIFFCHFESTVF